MKKIKKFSVKILLCALLVFPNVGPQWNNSLTSNLGKVPHPNSESLLTIYTYSSLLADPNYDFVGAYANYCGLSKDHIQVELFDDTNTIVSRAVLEKDNPMADVIIGIDNILIHTALKENILAAYESPVLSNISADLIQNLDPNHFVSPYDYGVIALYYNTMNINTTSNPELEDLTLQDILDFDLDKQLIVENPILSSPGLGFLLWTIAVFGDPLIDFDGLLKQDWREWWKNAREDIRIAPSWNAAFSEWYEGGSNRSLMVSYGTSPAYSACLYDDPSQKAIVSQENGQKNAWLQIEGIGLVNGAPNEAHAKDFIDWFLSEELQNNIPEHNWMYPANSNVNVSSTFSEATLDPSNVNILNDLISPTLLSENLEKWKTDWEESIIAPTVPGYSPVFFFLGTLIGIASNLIYKKKENCVCS